MLPEKPKPRETKKHEIEAFLEKYESYAMVYGDPVQKMFELMATAEDQDTQKSAAEILMSYRYPRIKAVDDQGKKGQTFQFVIAPAPLRGQTVEAEVVHDVKELLGG